MRASKRTMKSEDNMEPNDKISAILIAKYLAGEALPEEGILISDWITKSHENINLFKHWEEAWAVGNLISDQSQDQQKVWESLQKSIKKKSRGKLFLVYLGIAAAALLLVTFYFTFPIWNHLTTETKVNYVTNYSKNKVSSFLLPDSTNIVLNRNSSLLYPEEFIGDSRLVELSGEGYFEVAHLPDRPFIISIDQLKIKVLGTVFDVKSLENPPRIEVRVLEGTVALIANRSELLIDHGWMGRFDKTTKKMSNLKFQDPNRVAYATQRLSFINTPLWEVTEFLHDVYGVNFLFENGNLKNCRITSSFSGKSLNFVLDIISLSLNIKYQINGTDVHLLGNGCN